MYHFHFSANKPDLRKDLPEPNTAALLSDFASMSMLDEQDDPFTLEYNPDDRLLDPRSIRSYLIHLLHLIHCFLCMNYVVIERVEDGHR